MARSTNLLRSSWCLQPSPTYYEQGYSGNLTVFHLLKPHCGILLFIATFLAVGAPARLADSQSGVQDAVFCSWISGRYTRS